jgi:glutamate 5-kinase
MDKDILVIKVGSSTLTTSDAEGNTLLDGESFQRISNQIDRLHRDGYGIIIVSSAAISAGMAHAGVRHRPNKKTEMPELQRLASVGWRHVLNKWAEALPAHVIGELLITKQEVKNKSEGGELMQVIANLLQHGDICIVNENDAITHSEIAFGDNDTLAAILAAKLRESAPFNRKVKLLILSDINGVYQDKDDPSTVIRTIDTIESFSHIAGKSGSPHGTGGMETKFTAASIALQSGVEVWIGNGRQDDAVLRMLDGTHGTHFTLG